MKTFAAYQQGLFNELNASCDLGNMECKIQLVNNVNNTSGSFIITKTLEIKEDTEMHTLSGTPSSQLAQPTSKPQKGARKRIGSHEKRTR